MIPIPDALFLRMCGTFGWPFDAPALMTAGGVYAVTAQRTGPDAAPAEGFVTLGRTEAEALGLYRWQVALRCAQLTPALLHRHAATREQMAIDEAAIADVAAALAPAA